MDRPRGPKKQKRAAARAARAAQRNGQPWTLSLVTPWTFTGFENIPGSTVIKYASASSVASVNVSSLQGFAALAQLFDEYRVDSIEATMDYDPAARTGDVIPQPRVFFLYDPNGGANLDYANAMARPNSKSHRFTPTTPSWKFGGRPGCLVGAEFQQGRWYAFSVSGVTALLGHLGCLQATIVSSLTFSILWRVKLSVRGRI